MASIRPPDAPRRLSRLSRILAEAGLRPDRRFSQSFLVNPRALARIVEASGAGPRSAVIEVGAGLGNLTELLSEKAAHVTAVELDLNFKRIHETHLRGLKNVGFAYGDILEMDLANLRIPGDWDEHVVVGNIPYHITSRILMKLAAEREAFERAYILMQWEVAERLKARAGSRKFSVLTAKLRCSLSENVLFRISGRSFQPAARVDSALVEFLPLDEPLLADPAEREAFFAMLDAAFAQRRKTIGNALAAGSSGRWPREAVETALEEMNRARSLRAEQMPTQDLLALFRALRDSLGTPEWRLIRKAG